MVFEEVFHPVVNVIQQIQPGIFIQDRTVRHNVREI